MTPAPEPERTFFRAGALALSALEWGAPDAPPLLAIHGAGAHAHWWDELVPFLLRRWRVVAPDLRGHGRSDWAVPPAYGIEDFAGDLLVCLEERCGGRAALVGHSMGGRVAAWIAARHPERVRGLALLDTRMRGLEMERVDKWRGTVSRKPPSVYDSREQALGAFRLTPSEPDVAPAARQRLAEHAIVEREPGRWSLRFDRGVLSLDGSRLADLIGMLADVRCPALVLRGASSTVVGETQAADVARALGDCPVRVFPGGHHFLLARPEAVASAILELTDLG